MFARSAALFAALSLAATPALAQPSAQALSIQPAVARAGADSAGGNALSGENWVPALLFTAIVIGGVLLATGVIGDNDNDQPASP